MPGKSKLELLLKLNNKLFNSKLAKTQKKLDQGIPPIKYIDLYADQYRDPESFDLFAQNALLVEWDIDHTANPAMANVNFHCCFEQLRFTDSISKNRTLGLKFLDYIDIIHEILLQIETEDTGKLQLFSEGFQEMASIVDVYMLNYQCSYVGRKKKSDYKDGDFESGRKVAINSLPVPPHHPAYVLRTKAVFINFYTFICITK